MKTVLIIEDNNDIRENTAEILELAGYKALQAENGRKGVEIALAANPDIIICDIMMPVLDGYGVLHLLRKNAGTEHTPFIFVSAKSERSDLRKGMEMGADDYVTKPFDDIELLKAIEIRLKKSSVLQKDYSLKGDGAGRFLKDADDAGLINALEGQYKIEPFTKKEVLFEEGKRARHLFYLVSGKVKGERVNDDGKTYITDLFTAGDFVGYAALIRDMPYADSAIVLEDADVMRIPKDDFLKMIYGDMQIAAKFIRIITQNVQEKEDRLLNLAYNSLRKRVATALVELHDKHMLAGDTIVDLSRDDIAHYVGTATESLIRTLGDFKSEALIAIKSGKIQLIDVEGLRALPY